MTNLLYVSIEERKWKPTETLENQGEITIPYSSGANALDMCIVLSYCDARSGMEAGGR